MKTAQLRFYGLGGENVMKKQAIQDLMFDLFGASEIISMLIADEKDEVRKLALTHILGEYQSLIVTMQTYFGGGIGVIQAEETENRLLDKENKEEEK
jgi:predicted nucleic acid-binding protein